MYCYGCLYNAYTWKNQVYLSVITLVCELWVVWSLWICWESGFSCVICGPLAVCFLSTTKKKNLYENKLLIWLIVSFGLLSFSACQYVNKLLILNRLLNLNKLLILIAESWLHISHWNSCWGMFCGGFNPLICRWIYTYIDRDWPW